jgi:hypothetical protein
MASKSQILLLPAAVLRINSWDITVREKISLAHRIAMHTMEMKCKSIDM